MIDYHYYSALNYGAIRNKLISLDSRVSPGFSEQLILGSAPVLHSIMINVRENIRLNIHIFGPVSAYASNVLKQ